jgi:hypothetical protein
MAKTFGTPGILRSAKAGSPAASNTKGLDNRHSNTSSRQSQGHGGGGHGGGGGGMFLDYGYMINLPTRFLVFPTLFRGKHDTSDNFLY